MAKIKIRGLGILEFSNEFGTQLTDWKFGNYQKGIKKESDDLLIDLEGKGKTYLKNIEGIILDREEVYKNTDSQDEIIGKVKKMQERLKLLDSYGKAKWNINNYGYIIYKKRGGKKEYGKIYEEYFFNDALKEIFEYFEKNPEETICPQEIYSHFILKGYKKVEGELNQLNILL